MSLTSLDRLEHAVELPAAFEDGYRTVLLQDILSGRSVET